MNFLDVSCISNSYNKTLLYYLCPITEFYRVESTKLAAFITNDIGYFDNIMEQLEFDVCNLKNICYLKNGESIIWVFRMQYYNNAMQFMAFDEIDNLINQLWNNIELDIQNVIYVFMQIRDISNHINLGIGNSAMTRAQVDDKFDYSKRYHPSTQLNTQITAFIDYWTLLSYQNVKMDDEAKGLLKYKLDRDINLFKSQLNFLKFQFSLQCIIDSPFYEYEHRLVMESLYSKLQELMHNCYIGDFFIEYGPPGEINYSQPAYKSTRIQVSFILDNKQGYCLRFDFPHKGKNFAHINISDLNGNNALPIEQGDDVDPQLLREGISRKLFYEKDYKYWFVSNFEKKLMESDINEDRKNSYADLFNKYSHYNICPVDFDLKLSEYFEELNLYLCRLFNNDTKILNGGRIDEKLSIKRAIFRLDASMAQLVWLLPQFMPNESVEESRNNFKSHVVNYLYEFYEFDGFNKNDLLELDLVEIFELLEF